MLRLLLLIVLGVVVYTPAAAALDASGAAVIVDEAGEPLMSGTTRDVFTIELPEGAECQGDSQDGGYRVESFLLPVRHNPGDMKWGELAPTAQGSFALYDTATNPYVHQLTGVATDRGGPGLITNTAQFSFGVFLDAPELLASGRYFTGLACSRLDDTTRYWATEVRIDVDTTRPADEVVRWEVLTPVATKRES
ncbi:MAG: hypothetical protein Q8K63_02080, partial [Acidimicrobiales bacterium]|nr:hypothetical protein [Acidimicrobiales bacterium]